MKKLLSILFVLAAFAVTSQTLIQITAQQFQH